MPFRAAFFLCRSDHSWEQFFYSLRHNNFGRGHDEWLYCFEFVNVCQADVGFVRPMQNLPLWLTRHFSILFRFPTSIRIQRLFPITHQRLFRSTRIARPPKLGQGTAFTCQVCDSEDSAPQERKDLSKRTFHVRTPLPLPHVPGAAPSPAGAWRPSTARASHLPWCALLAGECHLLPPPNGVVLKCCPIRAKRNPVFPYFFRTFFFAQSQKI